MTKNLKIVLLVVAPVLLLGGLLAYKNKVEWLRKRAPISSSLETSHAVTNSLPKITNVEGESNEPIIFLYEGGLHEPGRLDLRGHHRMEEILRGMGPLKATSVEDAKQEGESDRDQNGTTGFVSVEDWPKMFRSNQPMYILTASKLTLAKIKRLVVEENVVDEAELARVELSSESLPDRWGLLQMGVPFAQGAKLQDIDTEDSRQDVKSIQAKVIDYIRGRLNQDKLPTIDDVIHFSPFYSSRGKLWLAWVSSDRLVFAAILDAQGSVVELLQDAQALSGQANDNESWLPLFFADLEGRGHFDNLVVARSWFEGGSTVFITLGLESGFDSRDLNSR